MTSLLLILSLLSLDVGRSRTTTTPRSIERTLVRVGVGLAQSYGDEANLVTLCQVLEGTSEQVKIREPQIYVDGVREGAAVCRVLKALWTTGLFVFDRSSPGDSVELRYTMLYQGLAIQRHVTITDGKIVSSASFACSLGPQGRCKAVRLRAVATEHENGTAITTSAGMQGNSGICPRRSRSIFRRVNGMVAGRVAGQLDGALAGAEREGRRLSQAGHEAITGYLTATINSLLRRTR